VRFPVRLKDEHSERLERGLATLEEIAERLCFVRPPFDLGNVVAAADAFDADLLLLDYIQRIAPAGEVGDRRAAVDSLMNHLRQFADADRDVFVAAVARSRDNKGRSSSAGNALGLASFRESSELELGADDAFTLVPEAATATRTPTCARSSCASSAGPAWPPGRNCSRTSGRAGRPS
jgi:replicative DNA helicase